MSEKKKMSVAEIMAAARAQKAAATGSDATPEPAAEPTANPPASPKTAAPKSAAAKPAAASAGGRPSVAEMMAMARAQKSGEAAAAPKPTAKPAAAADKPKPAAKPAAAKPAGGAPKTGVQRDTASILAAARAAAKPGPVSKADASPEVAARLQPAAKAKSAAEKPAAPSRALPPMPVRPAKPAKKDAAGENRRGFLEIALGSFMAMGFSALSVTGGLFTLGLARYMFPNVLAEPPSRFKVGFKEGFPAGKVETKFVPQYGVWVVNGEFQGQQQIYALKTVCTHLGCTPNWLEAEQKFKCPCHGSGFYKDGVNFEGPAPRPLERYAVRISDDGQLEIDKSRAFQEELGQWADPDSFVPV